MSVSINPGVSLGFNRPLTELVKRTLTITNSNHLPVAFKIKTTAPKLYCVRPNAGRIEPGESIGVSVQLQPLKEEPSPHAKCKDKFLVQSTTITPDKENLSLTEIWNPSDSSMEVEVHQQKIRVVYLPPPDAIVEEDAEDLPGRPSQQTMISDDSRPFDTVRQTPPSSGVNGHLDLPGVFVSEAPSIIAPSMSVAPATPPPDDQTAPLQGDDSFVVAREEQSLIEESRIEAQHVHEVRAPIEPRESSPVPLVNVNVHTPPPERPHSPPRRSFPISGTEAPTGTVSAQENELAAKLAEAQNEIQRLRALLAAIPDPGELKRRTGAMVASEEPYAGGETDLVSDAGTHLEAHDGPRQEGASPQQVGIIALLVFIITYLFF